MMQLSASRIETKKAERSRPGLDQAQRPPFDPRKAIETFVNVLKGVRFEKQLLAMRTRGKLSEPTFRARAFPIEFRN
jgi:hypothetical protein